MNIDFSGLLKLYAALSGASLCFIIKSGNKNVILASNNELNAESKNLIKQFYSEFSNNKFDLGAISQLKSVDILQSHFQCKSIYGNFLTNLDGYNYHLFAICYNSEKAQEQLQHLETVVNSIATQLNLNYELHEKLELTFSKIDAVVYSYNLKNETFDFISNSAEKILGLTEDEIRVDQKKILRKIAKDNFKNYKNFILKVKQGEPAIFDSEFKTNTGKLQFLHHVAEPIVVDGKIEKVVGVISDNTRERNIIDKLKKSEKRFGLLINTAIDFIYSLNGFGYLIQVNENGANALGYTSEEMLGKHFLDFAADYQKDDISKSFQNMLSSKSTIHFEIDLLHKLNKAIKYEFLATPLLEGDEITGMLGIGRDITRRRQNEEKIKQLNLKLKETQRLVEIERDRAKQQITILEEINILKNEFISNVSHELRTPLASIVGFAETIASDEDLPKDLVLEFSGIILTEGKRLARFIDDILDFSELESGGANLHKEEFNIIDMLNVVAKKATEDFNANNITFTALIPDAEITIFADKEKLIKAFNTIFENTLRFTKSGDHVSIVIQDFLKEVGIVISDNGNGISESDLEFLFHKFHSSGSTNASTPTAGIALSLVKQIFDHHKGLLQVKSSVGEGTTFIIRLPKKLI
ncbi:MAG: PAS domain-containing sensor histidine kinase [Bacteroidetes bacterium]|nr:PAS domain-containing sensor histidine kinase [Bacteroidota bacterium]MBU1116791.1 PAS domain-containing sensor histidine kinase [Bacteroidota bacterium]MBU1798370.1 PAS domain-containing sensor histidine kinase [Bacteroidota bacterium]